MPAAGFIAIQRIQAHQLAELQEVGNASGIFQRLVEFFAAAEHVDVLPEFFAQFRNARERPFQSGFVARHSAFVPDQLSQFAMERSDRSFAFGFEELFRAFRDSGFRLANRRMIGADFFEFGCGQIIANGVGKNEVTIGQSLHQRAGAEPVGAVIGEIGFADRIETRKRWSSGCNPPRVRPWCSESRDKFASERRTDLRP